MKVQKPVFCKPASSLLEHCHSICRARSTPTGSHDLYSRLQWRLVEALLYKRNIQERANFPRPWAFIALPHGSQAIPTHHPYPQSASLADRQHPSHHLTYCKRKASRHCGSREPCLLTTGSRAVHRGFLHDSSTLMGWHAGRLTRMAILLPKIASHQQGYEPLLHVKMQRESQRYAEHVVRAAK